MILLDVKHRERRAAFHRARAGRFAPYVSAFSASLHPVFLIAALVGLVAFGLSWFLRELPLRTTARAEGVGESFAAPRGDSSVRELERMITRLARPQERWSVYERLAERAGLDLPPPQLWLLARLGERPPLPAERLAAALLAHEFVREMPRA